MASKVVHISDETHSLAKQYCTDRGLRMSEWVTQLIKKGLEADLESRPGVTPTRTGKSLPRLVDGSGEELGSKPPFWSGDPAS